MPKTTQANRPNFHQILRKYRRFRRYTPGNRNKFAAAHTYYHLIGDRPEEAAELLAMHARHKGQREADGIQRRTARVVAQRRAETIHRAGMVLRNNARTREWCPTAIFVLATMMLYGYQTGFCCASQTNIGRGAGISRKQANVWIARLEEAGIIERVGYDWRGSKDGVNNWCVIFAVDSTAWMLFASLRTAIGGLRDSVTPLRKACAAAPRPAQKTRPPPGKRGLMGWEKMLRDFPKPGEWHWRHDEKYENEMIAERLGITVHWLNWRL